MFSTAARAAPEWTIPGIPLWGESVTLEHLAAALRDEGLGRRRVGHQPGALDVELDHGAEALRGDRLGRAEELAAGVVDEDVEPPVALEHAVEEGADRVLVADVELLVLEGARQARGQLGGLGERLGAAPAADHGGAEARQLERRLAAEAAAGAGDHADLAVEQAGPEDPRCACPFAPLPYGGQPIYAPSPRVT